jgi:hypothetical protein
MSTKSALATVAAALACLSVISSSATANIIYTINLPPTGDLTLTGTITTDGNLGTLTRADILDWDLTVYSASLSAGFEFTPLTSTLTMYSDGGRSPYVAIATATTLTLPSTDYVFNLEKANTPPYVDPYGQAVVDGAGSEYFRVETMDGRYDEVQIGLSYPLQLADAGVQIPYAGTPGDDDCHGQSVSALTQQYGGLASAATLRRYTNRSAIGTERPIAPTSASCASEKEIGDGGIRVPPREPKVGPPPLGIR